MFFTSTREFRCGTAPCACRYPDTVCKGRGRGHDAICTSLKIHVSQSVSKTIVLSIELIGVKRKKEEEEEEEEENERTNSRGRHSISSKKALFAG